MTTASGPAHPTLARTARWLLLLTLFLLPFESWLPQLSAGPQTVTTLEAAWGLALVAWIALLVAERRPRVDRSLLLALGALFIVFLASALTASGDTAAALTFVGRSAAGWLLFVAVADTIRDRQGLRRALATVVAAAALSAALGLLLLVVAGLSPQLGIKTFYVAGAVRLSGTFDYPNTAAMAYEAAAFLGLALIALDRRRRVVWVEVAGEAVILLAMMLTLSRGAALGAAIGLIAMAVIALIARRPRLAGAVVASAVAVVVLTVGVQVSVSPIQRLFTDAEQGLYGATYAAPAGVVLDNGAASVTVNVTNTGTLDWNVPGGSTFKLGYHLMAPGSTDVLVDGKTSFAMGMVVAEGQTMVKATIDAPDPTQAYDVAWDVLRGGYAWFSDKGVPVATTRIGPAAAVGALTSVPAPQAFLNSDDVDPNRTQLWTAAVDMVTAHPLLGVGPGTYRLRYAGYLGLGPDALETHSNNLYLQLAAETGLLGLLAFLAVVLVAVAPLVLRLAHDGPTSGTGWCMPGLAWAGVAALLGAVFAFLGHGFVDYFFAFNGTNGLWWASLGFVVAAPAFAMSPVPTAE